MLRGRGHVPNYLVNLSDCALTVFYIRSPVVTVYNDSAVRGLLKICIMCHLYTCLQLHLHNLFSYLHPRIFTKTANIQYANACRMMVKANRSTYYVGQKDESWACYANIASKMKENRSRRFGHVQKKKKNNEGIVLRK